MRIKLFLLISLLILLTSCFPVNIPEPECSADKLCIEGFTCVDGECLDHGSSIYFINPSNQESFIMGRPITLKAGILGSKDIEKVEFWSGSYKIGEDDSQPYETNWVVSSSGIKQVTAKAITTGGQELTDTVSINFKNLDPNPSWCIIDGKDECAEMMYYSDKEYLRTYKYYCPDPDVNMGWGEGYRLQGLSGAYEAFKNITYLEKMVRDIDGFFCIDEGISENNCDICPITYQGYGTKISTTPKEWGYYGRTYGSGQYDYDYFVNEGVLLKGVLRFIEFVYNDPSLHNKQYGDKTYKWLADKYLEMTVDLLDKWERRDLYREIGDGSGIYAFHDDPPVHNSRQNMTLPHNQQLEWAGGMLTLYRITGDVKYRDRSAKLLYHLKKNYYVEDGVVNWNYWDNAGMWDYEQGFDDGGLQHWEGEEASFGYKRISTDAMIDGWRHCLVFDDEDIREVIERNHLYARIGRKDYSLHSVPYVGMFDKNELENEFINLEKYDDTQNQWGYAHTSRYRLTTGQFWETLKSEYSKHDECEKKEIPIYELFNGATTNFRNVADITKVSNVVLEQVGEGKVEFGNRELDMSNLFLDAYVQIGYNFFSVNGDELPSLNLPVTVTLYNINDNNPKILVDDSVCNNCVVLSSGQDIKFSIPGAGVYKVAEDKTLLFKDDFESDSLSNWAEIVEDSKISVTSNQARSGQRAMQIVFDGKTNMYVKTSAYNVEDYIYKVSFKLSDDFTFDKNRDFYFGGDPANENSFNSLHLNNLRGGNISSTERGDIRRVYFQYRDALGFDHWLPQNRRKGPEIINGRWYDLEVHFVGSKDYVDYYIDGKHIYRNTMGDMYHSQQKGFVLGVMQGKSFYQGSARGKIFFDNFEVYKIE